jgi:hypothetical protein
VPHAENLRLAGAGGRGAFRRAGGTCRSYGQHREAAALYGFLAVLRSAAVRCARSESDHDYHQTLHDFAEQTSSAHDRLVLLLGGAVASGIRPSGAGGRDSDWVAS